MTLVSLRYCCVREELEAKGEIPSGYLVVVERQSVNAH